LTKIIVRFNGCYFRSSRIGSVLGKSKRHGYDKDQKYHEKRLGYHVKTIHLETS
jgi:hypothetical protein